MKPIERKLVAFARFILEESRLDMGDVDGGTIQDKAEELGLLKRVPVDKPCGLGCVCAEYTNDWPTTCLRYVDGVF